MINYHYSSTLKQQLSQMPKRGADDNECMSQSIQSWCRFQINSRPLGNYPGFCILICWQTWQLSTRACSSNDMISNVILCMDHSSFLTKFKPRLCSLIVRINDGKAQFSAQTGTKIVKSLIWGAHTPTKRRLRYNSCHSDIASLVFVTPWTETSVAIQGLCFGMKI